MIDFGSDQRPTTIKYDRSILDFGNLKVFDTSNENPVECNYNEPQRVNGIDLSAENIHGIVKIKRMVRQIGSSSQEDKDGANLSEGLHRLAHG